METGYRDIDGNEVREEDVLQSARNPHRRGVVVKFDALYLIDCSDDGGPVKYPADDFGEWRVIGRLGDERPS